MTVSVTEKADSPWCPDDNEENCEKAGPSYSRDAVLKVCLPGGACRRMKNGALPPLLRSMIPTPAKFPAPPNGLPFE